jgi:hypothetical protein
MTKMLLCAALVFATAALAETPYSGMQTRPIKSLSEQQVSDLQAGRGMGLALAAELNGYPGPSHLLKLRDQLDLSEPQRAELRKQFDAMKAEALPLGAKLIALETELDRQFASRTITPETLKMTTASIAETQGQLRETHLKYHLATRAMLSELQLKRYAELRGYGEQPHTMQHRH